MIFTAAIICGSYLLLGQLIKPSIDSYYRNRHGKTWKEMGMETLVPREYYGTLWATAPLLLPICGIIYVGEHAQKKLLPIFEYPGKLLAEHLKDETERRVLPEHVKDEIDHEAEKEVERLLNP